MPKPLPGAIVFLALLAILIIAANGALRPPSGAGPTTASIKRELATAVATKLLSQGYFNPLLVTCAPPPGPAPPATAPLHLVCQVTAIDERRPSKSPVWFEDVTCGLPVPAGIPSCGSSGGDAVQ
jgi:hypothetical protein